MAKDSTYLSGCSCDPLENHRWSKTLTSYCHLVWFLTGANEGNVLILGNLFLPRIHLDELKLGSFWYISLLSSIDVFHVACHVWGTLQWALVMWKAWAGPGYALNKLLVDWWWRWRIRAWLQTHSFPCFVKWHTLFWYGNCFLRKSLNLETPFYISEMCHNALYLIAYN